MANNPKNEIIIVSNKTLARYSNTLIRRSIDELSHRLDFFGSAILIVEDDSTLLNLLSTFLKDKGFHNIDTAENGQEAIQKLQTQKYRLVLLNIGIPEPNGMKILEFIKRSAIHTKTILNTGFYEEEIVPYILEQGASAFLKKPFNLDEVLSTVIRLLDQ